MADQPCALQELPPYLLCEILSKGRLSAEDLANLEVLCYAFRAPYGFPPYRFKSLAEVAAFQLSNSHPMFSAMPLPSRKQLLHRCGGNWKLVLRFLQAAYQPFGSVETPNGNVQVSTGKYHTLLVKDGSLYSCGSSNSGVLGHGLDVTRCSTLTRIELPLRLHVTYVSSSHNHAAFVTKTGELFTYGDNSSGCCGHGETDRVIFKPTQVEALKEIPCKQVATGVSYTVVLTSEGQVYTCGSNIHGQLGHGDTLERLVPRKVERFDSTSPVVQIAAGVSHTLALIEDGMVYSFGYGSNFCLGHGGTQNELEPRVVRAFEHQNICVIRVAAGDEHSVAIGCNGYVYTWGKGYCGALGHGDEIDRRTPALVTSLIEHRAVQVCARKRKTFIVSDEGLMFAFGWMGLGSLGLWDKGMSEKVVSPQVLESLEGYHVRQVSTGLYHTIVITNKGFAYGFGDNEMAQLGQDSSAFCLEPEELKMQDVTKQPDSGVASGST